MGRTPQPTAVLDAKGSFLRHPEYKRPKEPKPKTPLSATPPKGFNAEQKKLWRELIKMIPPGVAFTSDKWAAIRLVMLESKAREADKTDAPPMRGVESNRLLQLYIQFGLTPAARTRIQAEAAETDELEDFLSPQSIN